MSRVGNTGRSRAARQRPKPIFGISLTPYAGQVERAFEIAKVVDELGVDLIAIQDHPYNGSFLDTWTLISALATSTRRVRFSTNVADLPVRPPAMLAKASATLDIVTKGRLELGIGAGAFWKAIASYGGQVRNPPEAVAALEEAIQVIHLIWDYGESGRRRASFQGKYYRLDDAQTGPRPYHQIGIWIGASGPKMLRLIGRLGDGWSVPLQTYFPDDKIREAQQIIDGAAKASGRPSDSIVRIRNLAGIIDERGKLEKSLHGGGEMIVGSAKDWVNELVSYYRDFGLNAFIFWPGVDDDQEELEQIKLFAERVIPMFRESI